MVRCKQEFNTVDLKDYQQQYKRAKIAYLERKLSQLQREVLRLYRRFLSLSAKKVTTTSGPAKISGLATFHKMHQGLR